MRRKQAVLLGAAMLLTACAKNPADVSINTDVQQSSEKQELVSTQDGQGKNVSDNDVLAQDAEQSSVHEKSASGNDVEATTGDSEDVSDEKDPESEESSLEEMTTDAEFETEESSKDRQKEHSTNSSDDDQTNTVETSVIVSSRAASKTTNASTTAAPTTTQESVQVTTTTAASEKATAVPTTVAPTMAVPTTAAAPTTVAPTTAAPTTAAPTTAAPTTAAPTTAAPTTATPTTAVPTTAAPTTAAPTTAAPTTAAPTTAAPTTAAPTTAAPTTAAPTTAAPTTAAPTTAAPTTATPTTAAVSTTTTKTVVKLDCSYAETAYTGDTFDKNKLIVAAVYSDGTSEVVQGWSCDSFVFQQGVNYFTVVYGYFTQHTYLMAVDHPVEASASTFVNGHHVYVQDYDTLGKQHYQEYAEEINKQLQLINGYRQAVGASPLVLDQSLCDVAGYRIAEMEIENYYSHTHMIGDSDTGVSCMSEVSALYGISARAENISRGTGAVSSNTLGSVFADVFYNSERHRANMENAAYTKIGIAISYDGNTFRCVQIFQ